MGLFNWLFGNTNKHDERMQSGRSAHTERMTELNIQRERIQMQMENARQETQRQQIEAERQAKLKKLSMEKEQKEREDALRKQAQINEQYDKKQQRKQLQAAITYTTNTLKPLKKQIEEDQKTLQEVTEDLGVTDETMKVIDNTLLNWNDHTNQQLKLYISELETAQTNYQRDDDFILKAIRKTGVHETSVTKFLMCAHDIITCAVVQTASTNKLQIKMSTFGELIERLCQNKITVASYISIKFPQLKKFIPILAANDLPNLNDLRCKNEDEFNEDILKLLENGLLDSKNDDSKADDSKADEITEEKSFDQLLTNWGLSQFIEKFKHFGWDDASLFADIEDSDFTDMGLKRGHIKKFHKGMKGDSSSAVTDREIRWLKEICLKSNDSNVRNEWETQQKQKGKKIKDDLMIVSPVLEGFFRKMDTTVKQAQIILEYPNTLNNNETGLNETQLKVIQNQLKLEPENEDDDEKKAEMDIDDSEIRKKWKTKSNCQIFSESEKQWYDCSIAKITNDKEGEWLSVVYFSGADKVKSQKQIQRFAKEIKPRQEDFIDIDDKKSKRIKSQANTLMNAAIVKFNISDELQKECSDDRTKLLALDLAVGVEMGCVQLFQSQAIIRQSLILARNILQFKPADLSDETRQKLWKAVDGGIVNIFSTAIELVKISEKYFSFFVRFKQSFGFYISCYRNKTEEEKDKMSLFVSMEHLQKDVREFDQFQKQFMATVNNLETEAKKVITECVENTVGAKEYEKAITSRKDTKAKLIQAQKQYDTKLESLKKELDKLWIKKIATNGKLLKLKYSADMLTKSIQHNTQYMDRLRRILTELQKKQI